jgi:DNA-binding response OmpR family regulator
MHILLVEDNATLAHLFEVQLNRLGHEMIFAPTEAQAMAAFKAKTFDLVLIDIGLEGQQDKGIEILAEMKALVPKQRIGIVSSNDLKDMIRRAQEGGAEFYMVKPFTLKGLRIVLGGNREAINNYQPDIGEGRLIPLYSFSGANYHYNIPASRGKGASKPEITSS